MLAALCAFVVAIGVQSVTEVRDPRPGGWVVDQAGVLDDVTERTIGEAAAGVHARHGAELVVAVVDDVPGSPKAFATALFAHWRLGRAGVDDGVLVLLVMGQRRLEIETGVGMEVPLPAWWLAEMQADRMVPRFKQRAFGEGLADGVAAIAARLDTPLAERERDSAPGEYRSDGSPVRPPAGAPGPSPARADAGAGERDRGGTGWLVGLGGLAGLGGLGGVLYRRRWVRQRTCQACRRRMHLLDELADDAHLSAGQQTEERIGSVDYDVLICRGCQTTRILRHGRWFSGRSACPSCQFKTLRRSSHTITAATYDHGGTVEVTEDCAHCAHRRTYRRSTPRLTRPSTTSSSSSSRGAWSSSSRSSSSSSSRSSGGGGGGGRSRGGGAGSSW